jgi:uncharacterized protein
MPTKPMAETVTSYTRPHTTLVVFAFFIIAILASLATYFYIPAFNLNNKGSNIPTPYNDYSRRISVSGTSTIYTAPDLAVAHFQVNIHDQNIATAQKEVAEKIAAVTQVFELEGIPKENIQTSNYAINTVYNYDDQEKPLTKGELPPVKYYEASHTLTVRIEDLTKVEEVLNLAVENGITDINNIEFTLKDFAKAREQAFKQAGQIVQERSQYIAAALGEKLGVLITANASYYDYPWNYYASANQAVGYNYEMPSSSEGSISAGQVKVTVDMNADYEIKGK